MVQMVAEEYPGPDVFQECRIKLEVDKDKKCKENHCDNSCFYAQGQCVNGGRSFIVGFFVSMERKPNAGYHNREIQAAKFYNMC